MPEKKTSAVWTWICTIVLLIIVAYGIIFFSANSARTTEDAWVFIGVEGSWILALGIAAIIGAVAYPVVRRLLRMLGRLFEYRKSRNKERRPE